MMRTSSPILGTDVGDSCAVSSGMMRQTSNMMMVQDRKIANRKRSPFSKFENNGKILSRVRGHKRGGEVKGDL
jgi:hypothetical protein